MIFIIKNKIKSYHTLLLLIFTRLNTLKLAYNKSYVIVIVIIKPDNMY